MFTDGHKTKIIENPLNDNFHKKEFQELWKQINNKYAYVVQFESEELINKSIETINRELFVAELKYTTTVGRQKDNINNYSSPFTIVEIIPLSSLFSANQPGRE
jgi:type III restriction enzyme